MARTASFWRNVGVIGLLHVAVLAGLTRWSGRTKKSGPTDILWMDGGAATATEAIAVSQIATPVQSETEPAVMPSSPESSPERTPVETAPAESAIQLPTPTAPLTATPAPTLTPSVKSSPKPTPSPKSTPKKSPAKTSPTATPKSKPTLAKKTPAPEERKKLSVKPDVPAIDSGREESAAGSAGKTGAPGAGGRGSGPGGASQFSWYASMLHDRFFSEWVQPTTVVASGAKMSALVRVRIEKDGRVKNFEIVRPSGNVVVDESIAAVAKRVTQVDPLPPGLGNAGHYDVKINFELSPEQ